MVTNPKTGRPLGELMDFVYTCAKTDTARHGFTHSTGIAARTVGFNHVDTNRVRGALRDLVKIGLLEHVETVEHRKHYRTT